ncbi:MAG: orotidine-5'-phosphate decarboxylase [Bdellovibrionales bacterium]|jgi:orotidine-5'-phosphate decarboxylase|nr:orotidine-5'-phosphate decarboxylase [Bdellovibrionales bacterium]
MGLKKIIVALDNMKREDAEVFLTKLQKQSLDEMPMVKIGLEMFLKHGPSLVTEIHEKYNTPIFLDLKLHDIPNTVHKAILSLEGLPIKFLTIHLSGGVKMIEKAIEAQKLALPHTDLLGVSFLTSLGAEDFNQIWDIGTDGISAAFERLINLALETNLAGVVSSVNEVELIKELESRSSKSLIKVTPGIRFEDEIKEGQLGDQKRVASPSEALKNGSNFLVIGRSLTQTTSLDKRMDQLRQL